MIRKRLYGCALACVLAAGSIAAVAANDGLNIRLRDDCDPATFDAAVGPGTCVGGGGTTFAEFLAEFQATGDVDKWRFNNDRAEVDRGTPIMLTNRGGETHTFTRVAEFAGGVVEILNAVPGGGTLTTAPECLQPNDPDKKNNLVLDAGDSAVGQSLRRGERAKYQCCIHPWMHAEITGK